MSTPRLIQTYLPEGTLEGPRIIEVSESSIKAFIVPRIKLGQIKDRPELKQPAIYLLINSGDNQLYIGESENFFHRIKTHDQSKDFWDLAVAIVSNTNTLGKTDVKYLESLAVEKAKLSAAMKVLNKTVPARNTIHEFQVHSMESVLDDIALIAESLGFSIFSTQDDRAEVTWHVTSKKTNARAQFRGDKFIVLAGSVMDIEPGKGWQSYPEQERAERKKLIDDYAKPGDQTLLLTDNISFKSPNHAGRILLGRSANAWTTWKNHKDQTMDEVMRKSSN